MYQSIEWLLLVILLWHSCLEARINGNSALVVTLDADRIQAQVIGVGPPADTHQQHVTLQLQRAHSHKCHSKSIIT